MTEAERHDWMKIIAELEAAGVSVYKIATMLDEQYYTVSRWRDKPGVKIEYFTAKRLLAIHAENVPHETAKN